MGELNFRLRANAEFTDDDHYWGTDSISAAGETTTITA
jgi:hypothetical protein